MSRLLVRPSSLSALAGLVLLGVMTCPVRAGQEKESKTPEIIRSARSGPWSAPATWTGAPAALPGAADAPAAQAMVAEAPVAVPAAAYVPYVRTGNLVFISGHIAKKDGKAWVGQLGKTMQTDEGKQAARAIAIDLMGTLQAAVGDLSRVRRIVKLMSLVNSAPDFTRETGSSFTTMGGARFGLGGWPGFGAGRANSRVTSSALTRAMSPARGSD